MVARHHHGFDNNNDNASTTTSSSPSPTNTATTAALQAASSTNYTLAKIEVAIYCILIIPTLIVVYLQVVKRGNNKGGWFYSASYIVVQLVGAILVLAHGEGSVSVIGEILSLIGLAPLMMAVKSSISSCAKETHLDGSALFKPAFGTFYHVVVVASAVISALGYSKMFNSNASENAVNHAETMVKASCVLFFIAWVWMTLLDVVVLSAYRQLQTTKKVRSRYNSDLRLSLTLYSLLWPLRFLAQSSWSAWSTLPSPTLTPPTPTSVSRLQTSSSRSLCRFYLLLSFLS